MVQKGTYLKITIGNPIDYATLCKGEEWIDSVALIVHKLKDKIESIYIDSVSFDRSNLFLELISSACTSLKKFVFKGEVVLHLLDFWKAVGNTHQEVSIYIDKPYAIGFEVYKINGRELPIINNPWH